MKRVFINLLNFRNNEILCFLLLQTSIIMTLYYSLLMNPFEFSLSEIGRHNSSLNSVWSILISIALYLNVKKLYIMTGYNSRIGIVILKLGIMYLAISNHYLYMEGCYDLMHIITAFMSIGLFIIPIIMCLIYVSREHIKYLIVMMILIISYIYSIIMIIIMQHTPAIIEIIPMIFTILALIMLNNIDYFKIRF